MADSNRHGLQFTSLDYEVICDSGDIIVDSHDEAETAVWQFYLQQVLFDL